MACLTFALNSSFLKRKTFHQIHWIKSYCLQSNYWIRVNVCKCSKWVYVTLLRSKNVCKCILISLYLCSDHFNGHINNQRVCNKDPIVLLDVVRLPPKLLQSSIGETWFFLNLALFKSRLIKLNFYTAMFKSRTGLARLLISFIFDLKGDRVVWL